MDELDPLIHQATRLRVMTLLHRNREASAVWVRQTLGLTPGNLESHVARLVAAGYLHQSMGLTARGFESRIRITRAGEAAFTRYVEALQGVLSGSGASAAQKKDDAK